MDTTPLATTVAVFIMASAVNQEAAGTEVLMDSTLRLLSIAGSIGGGFMALAFFPTKKKEEEKNTVKRDAIRWLGCSIFGGSFSPFVIEHLLPKYGVEVNTSTALATSAFLGMFAWAIVAVIPQIIQLIPKMIESKFWKQ